MAKVQLGIDKLYKANMDSPWEIAFTYNDKKYVKKLSVDKDGEISVGTRFIEVLSAIQSTNNFPLLIEKEDLTRMEMTSTDAFTMYVLKGEPTNIEITFRYYRELIRPTSEPIQGKNISLDLSEELTKEDQSDVIVLNGKIETISENVVMPVMQAKAINKEPEAIPDSDTAGKGSKGELSNIETADYVSGIEASSSNAIQIIYPEYINNRIDTVPLDDRLTEFFFDNSSTELATYSYNMRIGDVILPVPPLAIEVNRSTDVTKVSTLRSKNSMLVKSGHAQTDITLTLYFHDVEAINGRPVFMEDELADDRKHTYYMDGLRTLIAQFKHVPFVPIDNEYLNEVHDIQAVSLRNLVVETVQDFPNCLSATLTLSKFEHQAYMPKTEFLGQAINYPLMRWFIQRSMGMERPEDYTKTFLKPIVGQLKNDFKFLMADEDQLNTASEAVLQLRAYGTNLLEMKRNFENPYESEKTASSDIGTMYGQLTKDGIMSDKILGHYNKIARYQKDGELKNMENLSPDKENEIFFDVYSDEDYKNMYGSLDIDAYERAKKLAGEKALKMNQNTANSNNNWNWEDFIDDFYKKETDAENFKFKLVSGYYPEGSRYYNDLFSYKDIDGLYIGDYKDKDVIVMRVYNVTTGAVDDLEKYKMKKLSDNKLSVYIIPVEKIGDGSDFEEFNKVKKILKKISTSGEDAVDNYDAAVKEYEDLQALVKDAENGIKMNHVPLEGMAIMKSLKVIYENNFSSIQQQAMEQPTLQFLGGNDGYLHATFRMDDEALNNFMFILETSDRYARQYRRGISTGFLEIENDLLQLFGIKAVLPEITNVNTAQGFPGQYDVEMTFYAFNKSQKSQESVQGMSSINVNDDSLKESRKYDSVDSTEDFFLIESQLKNMEIYPDLELPTYEEVIDALRWCGAGMTTFENYSGAKYVDPDFYIYTPDTMRQLIQEIKETPTEVLFRDENGITFKTSTISESENGVISDSKNADLMNALSQAAPLVSSKFSWGDDDSDTEEEEEITESDYKSPEVFEYVTNSDELNKIPSYADWHKWHYPNEKLVKKEVVTSEKDKDGNYIKKKVTSKPHERNYQDWLENSNPTDGDIYKKILELTDKNFSDFFYNDKGDLGGKGTARYNVTYASVDDIRDAEYNYLVNKNPKLMSNGKKKRKLDSLKYGDYKKLGYKLTRERFVNYMRALVENLSGWTQFNGKNAVKIDDRRNRVGMMGISIRHQAETKEEAKRLAWDWEYNMERGFEILKKRKDQALEKEEIKYLCQPIDWMIQAYGTGSIKDSLERRFYKNVITIFEKKFNSYENRFASADAKFNDDIMSYSNQTDGFQGMTSIQSNLIKRDRATIINELFNLGYIYHKYDKKKYTSKQKKAKTKEYLEGLSTSELVGIYESLAYELFQENKISSHATTESGAILYTGQTSDLRPIEFKDEETKMDNRSKYPSAYENYTIYKRYAQQFLNNTDQIVELPTTRSEKEIFKDMWKDELRYDHRFRLIRAFPTFYMFFIDEGKWMGSYRIWDNVYGYNAIQEIDVYRSRKIAADTVKLRVSNVYSNITSLPSSYSSNADSNYKVWDNLLLNNPSEAFISARKQLSDRIILQTGARLQLRLGYGSSVNDLPIIFNGTITEMDLQESMEILAQGDAIELGSIVVADPDDEDTGGLGSEPRQIMCKMLGSKGNWLKDVVNMASDNYFFKDAASGVAHFGKPEEAIGSGYILPFSDDYGEIGVNIYSSIGLPIREQWAMTSGKLKQYGRNTWSYNEDPGSDDDLTVEWNNPYQTTFKRNILDGSDENDIKLALYGNTYWDIGTSISYIFPDYIFAVHPFETRSTVFYGKPQWDIVYGYNGMYEKIKNEDGTTQWTRTVTGYLSKPYAQAHFFDAYQDMIWNNIKTSSDEMYTNAFVTYSGKAYGPIYADYDINFAMQRTAMVDSIIVGGSMEETQALYYGASTIRDSLKDMYRGDVMILGNPTIKPYDICYLKDDFNDMNGTFQVKAVHHSFSQESGFITTIEPDLLATIDDVGMMRLSEWLSSMATTTIGSYIGAFLLKRMIRRMWGSYTIKKALEYGKEYGTKGLDFADKKSRKVMTRILKDLPEDLDEVKAVKGSIKTMINSKRPVISADMTNEEIEKVKQQQQAYDDKMKKTKADLKEQEKALKKKVTELKDDFKNVSKSAKKDAKAIEKAKKAYTEAKGVYTAIKAAKGTATGAVTIGKTVATASRFLISGNVIGLAINVGIIVVSENMVEAHRRKKAQYQCCIIQPMMYKGQSLEAGINGHAGLVMGEPLGFYDKILRGIWDENMEDDFSEVDALSILSLVPKASAKYYAFLENGFIDGVTGLFKGTENNADELMDDTQTSEKNVVDGEVED